MLSKKAQGEPEKSGSCGENVCWEFDESTGTLTISGTGEDEIKKQVPGIFTEEIYNSLREA